LETGKSNYPMVSIVILNYNGRKNLGKLLDSCLSSVLKTDYPNFEVLFIDNGSTDGSIQYIRDRFGQNKKLRVIPLDKNYGYAKGNNLASKYADINSGYFVFLSTDVKISSAWLREMVNLIEKVNKLGLHEVAAISSLVFDVLNDSLIDELYIRYPHGTFYIPRKSEPSLKNPIEIDFPTGEAFLIKKEAFKYVGGFDDNYFLYYDDVDLGWRLRLLGYKILLNPSVKVLHFRSSTVKGEVKRRKILYFCERNRLITCIKNLGKLSLVALLLYEIVSLQNRLLKRKREITIEYLKALHNILTKTTWKRIMANRRQVQLKRRISDKKIFELSTNKIPRNLNKFGHNLYDCFT